jgi:hypothetical protein
MLVTFCQGPNRDESVRAYPLDNHHFKILVRAICHPRLNLWATRLLRHPASAGTGKRPVCPQVIVPRLS